MKVKMLKTAAGPGCNLTCGKTYDVDAKFGASLIEADAAVQVRAPAPKRIPDEGFETAHVEADERAADVGKRTARGTGSKKNGNKKKKGK